MCGIFGAVSLSGAPLAHPRCLGAMAAALAHRGPDGERIVGHERARLGARRLAIMDLTTGDQPFESPDHTIWMICNGEIYNAPALREEGTRAGYPFRSSGDIETIVPLYQRFGPDAVARLEGMFGLAVWDDVRARLVLARDRAGEKPLFWTEVAGELRFASEVQALLVYPDQPRRVNPAAVALYAALGYVPAPLTMIMGISKLPPAHLLFPLLVWAPLRFKQPGVVTSSFVVAAIAIAGAVNGATPLGNGSATVVVQILEGLLAAVSVTMLLLGAVLAERAAADEALERAHATLAEAQEVAHIGSWEWSVLANRVTWSDELCRLYELAPQSRELTFESFLEHVHPEDREVLRQTLERAYVDRLPFAVDHRIVLSDGHVRWLQGRGRVILDETGTPVRMVGTSQDVTERKRVDELRDTILSTVSHELRTPLTSILGFSLTLKDKDAKLADDAREAIVDHLAEQAGKLDRLLSDLLDLDRLRRGFIRPTFRATNVGWLATQVATDFAVDGHPIEVCAQPVVAEIDAPKVERIIENLLANALKHTPRGTKICVRVESCEDGVLITVDDRGPGVPEDHRQAIFEIFNRGGAVSDTAGTGIGLSLVSQFAALHGGRVWVEENPGGGSSFRVLLPTERPG
jgi:PAS domain S-box-containing protein